MASIFVFLPFIAAALYGFSYVVIERLSGQINLTSYYLISTVIFFLFALGHGYLKGETVSVSALRENPSLLLLILVTSVAGALGWLCTTYAIKNISASYASFGEISYPLFALLFSWLILGVRHFDFSMLAGGFLIMAGSFILVYGRMRAG